MLAVSPWRNLRETISSYAVVRLRDSSGPYAFDSSGSEALGFEIIKALVLRNLAFSRLGREGNEYLDSILWSRWSRQISRSKLEHIMNAGHFPPIMDSP